MNDKKKFSILSPKDILILKKLLEDGRQDSKESDISDTDETQLGSMNASMHSMQIDEKLKSLSIIIE